MAKTDNSKDSFILRREWAELLNNISAEQAGALIKSICAYAFGDGDQDNTGDPVVDTAMYFIRPTLDRDLAKYEARKEAGAQGGAPAGNKNASKERDAADAAQAKTSKNNQEQAKQPVYVCVSGCVSDSVPVCDHDSANAESATADAVAVSDTATAASPQKLWEEAVGRRCTKAEIRELSKIETEYGPNRLLHGIREAVRADVCKLSYVEAAAKGCCNIHNGIPPDKYNLAGRQLTAQIDQLEAAIAAESDPDKAKALLNELEAVSLQYLQLHGQHAVSY